ncbi:transcriptional regulator [Terribacillus saccharophilus]|uniref:ArsR/SmtB family transcription factor n=1 Tax=Terribacillus saccharophilus TaxID=361277 RepID=UPI000BA79163|nr:metalloregulator ArsR/SmtB family transcription factor [Terribacillus saccharophilus]PAF22125.1 transcriptional regulator [Terribacillus saccharophilus]
MNKKMDVCEITCIHEDKVNRVRTELDQQNIQSVTTLFKALADETRAQIAFALSIEEELCVCDVANIVNCTMASTSHHLRTLNKSGLTKTRKAGKIVYYSFSDPFVKELVRNTFADRVAVLSTED